MELVWCVLNLKVCPTSELVIQSTAGACWPGRSRTLEHCRLARLGLTQQEKLSRLAPSFLKRGALRQRLVNAVRMSLGRLLGPDSLPPLLCRLVCGRRSDVGKRVAGVDGHGQGVGRALADVWPNCDWAFCNRRPSAPEGWVEGSDVRNTGM